MYNLAKHPEIQQKVFEEIREVIGDDAKKSTNYKDFNNLKYLEMVIKESIRMYPPVPFFSRHLTEESSISANTLNTFLHIYNPYTIIYLITFRWKNIS